MNTRFGLVFFILLHFIKNIDVSKNKLEKFAENLTFPNFFQIPFEEISQQDASIKGRWNVDFFKNDNPIVLELGCGRGEYAISLAKLHPQLNFIGVDRKGARMWKGCKYAIENHLPNVAFVRTQIQFLHHFFAENEVSEIWLTFPDPQPKRSKVAKRLTSSFYLDIYKRVLQPSGCIHLKTDSELLFEYTKEVIQKLDYKILELQEDIYSSDIENYALAIQTYYEKMWLEQGHKIYYLKFCLI